jgi:hypothetical protein
VTETQASGNRWEPATPPAPQYAAPPARPRIDRHEVRAAGISAAAAAVVVVVAAAGFTVGRATAPEQSTPVNGQPGQFGQDGQRGGPPGFQAPGS